MGGVGVDKEAAPRPEGLGELATPRSGPGRVRRQMGQHDAGVRVGLEACIPSKYTSRAVDGQARTSDSEMGPEGVEGRGVGRGAQ